MLLVIDVFCRLLFWWDRCFLLVIFVIFFFCVVVYYVFVGVCLGFGFLIIGVESCGYKFGVLGGFVDLFLILFLGKKFI